MQKRWHLQPQGYGSPWSRTREGAGRDVGGQRGAGGIAHAGGALIHAVSQQMVKHDCCVSPASETLESPVASANMELCGEENWGRLILN